MLTAYDQKTGQRLPATSPPLFVHRGKNGIWKPCSRADAEAVSVPGVGLCQLDTGPELEPEIIQYEDENGDLVETTIVYPVAVVSDTTQDAIVTEVNKQADEHAGQIVDLETGALDLADAIDGMATDTEAALLDLADTVDTTTTTTEAALMELGDMVAALMEERG